MVTLGAAGWRASGTAWSTDGRASGDEVLWHARGEDGLELAALTGRPGRVRVFLRTLDEPDGDPAAFALACGQLFDALARPREEVVALEERGAAGAAALVRGAPPPTAAGGSDSGAVVDAVLAGAAAIFALLAARARRPERVSAPRASAG